MTSGTVVTLRVAMLLLAAATVGAQVPAGETPPAAAPASPTTTTPTAASQPSAALLDALSEAYDVAVSPDGRNVYVTGFRHGTVVVFASDPRTGALRHTQTLRNGQGGIAGMGGPRAVIVSDDGRHVYVTGLDSGTVAVFARDPASGALTFVEKHTREDVASLDGATSLALSPDQRHLYVGGLGDGTVTVFRRDPGGGRLFPISAVTEGVDGVQGLAGAREVVVSPDGKHVYATGLAESSVVAFGRDPDTGALTFIEARQNGRNGVEGLVGAWGLRLSPDGKHLYVASQFDDSVSVFARDPDTGKLSIVETRQYEEEGVSGMDGAITVTLSPDGEYLYVAASGEGALGVFRRDPETGKLTFVESVRDRKEGVRGLGGIFNAAVSPDGRYVYAVGFDDSALVRFARDPATGKLRFLDVIMRSADDAPL